MGTEMKIEDSDGFSTTWPWLGGTLLHDAAMADFCVLLHEASRHAAGLPPLEEQNHHG